MKQIIFAVIILLGLFGIMLLHGAVERIVLLLPLAFGAFLMSKSRFK